MGICLIALTFLSVPCHLSLTPTCFHRQEPQESAISPADFFRSKSSKAVHNHSPKSKWAASAVAFCFCSALYPVLRHCFTASKLESSTADTRDNGMIMEKPSSWIRFLNYWCSCESSPASGCFFSFAGKRTVKSIAGFFGITRLAGPFCSNESECSNLQEKLNIFLILS